MRWNIGDIETLKTKSLLYVLMGSTATQGRTEPLETTQVSLRIWHPNCWTLRATEDTDAGLVAHGVYEHDGLVACRATAHADTTDEIDALIDHIDASDLTDEVKVINEYFGPTHRSTAAGNATQELLVEYEPHNSIHDAFVSRGFLPEEEIRAHGGHEYWTVIVTAPRAHIQDRLDEIREEMNAEITVEGMKSAGTGTKQTSPAEQLSERQREVFELARTEDYYTWPRQTSASELATQVSVSKTTFLEHLRKAEAKILGQND
jgi:predicted DNA binding protein